MEATPPLCDTSSLDHFSKNYEENPKDKSIFFDELPHDKYANHTSFWIILIKLSEFFFKIIHFFSIMLTTLHFFSRKLKT